MSPEKTPSDRGYVLIVDDLPINVKVAESILADNGFRTAALTESQGIVDWAATNHPDLILMDIMMPGLNGLEACSRLKQNVATAQIPVIFLTAKSGTEGLVKGFEVGGDDYVTKPFQAEELIARVSAHIRIRHLQRDLSLALSDLEKKNLHLEESISHIAKLKDAMLRICAWTKQVNIDGHWISIDEYLSKHLGIQLTHGISETALTKLFSEDIAQPAPDK